MKKMSFLMLLVSLTIFSCSKDEELTKTDILTQNEWNLVSSKIFFNDVEDPDGADTEPCDFDDIHNFMENGTYTIDTATDLCDGETESEIETGTWALSSDETELTINLDGEVIPGKINELTESVMRLSLELVDDDGMTIRFESTFNAK